MLILGAEECSDGPHSDRSTMCVYLQNEDEVVDGFSALVNVVLRRALVALIEFEFLDDVGVPEDPQQDFLCDLERAEKADLCGGGVQRAGVKAPQQDSKMDAFAKQDETPSADSGGASTGRSPVARKR